MTVTIQKTSKAIKKKLVISRLVAWGGWLIFIIGLVRPINETTVLIGALMGTVGCIMLVSARIQRWWNHA